MMVCQSGQKRPSGSSQGTLTIFAGKQWFTAQHLGKDASHAPNVYGLCVFLEREHDFWCSIPSGRHVFGHEPRVVICRSRRSSKAKIAHFEIAIRVQQEIRRFQVPMQNVGGVHGLEGAQSLIDEILAMVVREVLCSDNTMHVGLHQFLGIGSESLRIQLLGSTNLYQVDLCKGFIISWLLNIEDRDNVFVIEVS